MSQQSLKITITAQLLWRELTSRTKSHSLSLILTEQVSIAFKQLQLELHNRFKYK